MRRPPTGSRTSLSSTVLLAAPAAWIGDPRVMSLACAVISLLALYRLRSRADPAASLFAGDASGQPRC